MPKPELIGALLRVPARAVHRRLIRDLNARGFADLSLPHIAVLQYPGPDGVRPGTLAERAGISKQAMNQLLGTLQAQGYLSRAPAKGMTGARVVRLTQRGRAAYAAMCDILEDIELEWSEALGATRFARLKALLGAVWDTPLTRDFTPGTDEGS